jgi:hypothetical protein
MAGDDDLPPLALRHVLLVAVAQLALLATCSRVPSAIAPGNVNGPVLVILGG